MDNVFCAKDNGCKIRRAQKRLEVDKSASGIKNNGQIAKFALLV